MRSLTTAAILALLLATAARAAEDRGAFVVTLGNDTTSVDRHLRAGDRLVIEAVGRTPRVLRRRFEYEYRKGALVAMTMHVLPPGSMVPTQTVRAIVDGDSLRTESQSGAAAPVRRAVAFPRGTIVASLLSPWAVYEGEFGRLLRSRSDTLGGRVLYLGAANTERYLVRRLGRDSVAFTNTRDDVFHARVDRNGRILGTRALAGTYQVEARRVPALDLDAMAIAFQARDQAGSGLGTLSPRDTVRASLPAGATLTIDYGRPAKRGRLVFGSLVPFGEVWRTGANAATQLRTDRALHFSGTVVPAGFYSLWTIPRPDGWKLVFNGETGQWGTRHDPERDLHTVDLEVGTLPQVVERFTISVAPTSSGGVLQLDWDTTRASAAFTVKPE